MKALVTGGGGFLGRRIVELLRERGDEVSFLARGSYPEVEKTGATGIQADLRDAAAVKRAVEGNDVVFHVAALADSWGRLEDFRAINVDGTRNVLDAMELTGAPRLVFTSTPSVTSLTRDVQNGPQDLPYPDTYESPYGETKAEAERMVRAANSRHVATVSLRPHLIFGPREDKMFPRVIERARRGRLPIVGDGTNKVDFTYVDNAAWAHLDAERALVDHTSACAGKAYFISNDEPVVLWDWVGDFLDGVGAPRPTRRVSQQTAWRLGSGAEWVWRTFGLRGEPPMSRMLAAALGTSHWYDMEPAKRDLGYRVRVGMQEGTAATVRWFSEDPGLGLDGEAAPPDASVP